LIDRIATDLHFVFRSDRLLGLVEHLPGDLSAARAGSFEQEDLAVGFRRLVSGDENGCVPLPRVRAWAVSSLVNVTPKWIASNIWR